MQIDGGLLTGAAFYASPNFDLRPVDEISLIVLHCISLPPGQYGGDAVQRLFCNQLDCSSHPDFESLRDLQVSSHLVIRRDGGLEQYVSFEHRAWHAGVSTFEGRDQCNDYSVGIELEGTDVTAFSSAQYDALQEAIVCLIETYDVDAVVGHEDVAPGRKTDPGACFDWQTLRDSLGGRVRIRP